MPSPTRQVSIRLATDGKAQVVRDFGDLADAGDASAKRISRAYDRAADDSDAALARLQKASERMASIAQTPIQQTIAANAGSNVNYGSFQRGIVDEAEVSASSSAKVIEQQMAAGEAAAQRLLASIDPLYAAQQRYNVALEEAALAYRSGALNADQYTQVQAGLRKQLDDSTVGMGNMRAASGNARIAQMELMAASRGMTDALAVGMPVSRALTMEMGRLAEAAAFMGGGLGKVGEFMAGPWGIGVMIAAVALVPLIGNLISTKNASEEATDKLKKQADQDKINSQADREFAQTLDGVEKGIRALIKAYDDYENRLKGMPEKELLDAQAKLKVADAAHKAAQETLNQAKAQLQLQNAYSFNPAAGAGAALASANATSAAMAQVTAAQTDLDRSAADIDKARESIVRFQSIITTESSGKTVVDGINKSYDQQIEKTRQLAVQQAARARAAGDEARAQALVTTELKKQVDALNAKRQADIKAAESHDRKGPANAGGTAIFNDQIANFFDIANKYRGDSETRDRGVLQAFFREANINLDPEKQAWCAAFVNAVLAAGGVHGTNSQAAGSFLNYGKDDTHSPQRGDVVVVKSAASPSGMHVGILDSIDKKGDVTLLAGNTGNKVGEETVTAKNVLAVRRPPTPSEQATFDEQAASKAETATGNFDSELERLRQQYLQAYQKVAAAYESQAVVQDLRAKEEHDAEAKQIATNLAQGKYGDATSELAQTRARQLQAANDAAFMEKDAAIRLANSEKWLEQQDAANERSAQYRIDALQYEESIAKTGKERHDLEQQIIDIQFDEKKKHLEYLLALAKLTGKTEDAAKIQDEINQLPVQKARASNDNDRNNVTPLHAFFNAMPQNMAQVGDEMQNSLIKGIQSLNDGLTDAIVNSKSLGDAFHAAAQQMLADMIKLALQQGEMALFKTILGAVGSIGGSFGGGGTFSGSTDLSGISSTASDAGSAVSNLSGFATGTQYAPGGLAWVGEHGKELLRLPQGSQVFNASNSRRMAANDASIGEIHIPINIDATGADPAGLARVQGELAQLRQTLPGMIVNTVHDAQSRFVLGGRR